MVSLLCSPSFDPDEDDKKIPHTAALKRVTEPTRQKRREERKLTNRGEDIVGSSNHKEAGGLPAQSAGRKRVEREMGGELGLGIDIDIGIDIKADPLGVVLVVLALRMTLSCTVWSCSTTPTMARTVAGSTVLCLPYFCPACRDGARASGSAPGMRQEPIFAWAWSSSAIIVRIMTYGILLCWQGMDSWQESGQDVEKSEEWSQGGGTGGWEVAAG
ncbi:hypothetical protein V493_04613 [Pseudogymnoascus sp. VKM F-4281 (FW-2241)]|nr:hypothetical protein V493_04613 [Pseudogymnoascus sp. VKM F-4281 (FW-2241)]